MNSLNSLYSQKEFYGHALSTVRVSTVLYLSFYIFLIYVHGLMFCYKRVVMQSIQKLVNEVAVVIK